MKRETMENRREQFDLWFNENVDKACRSGLLAHGSFYLKTPGSIEATSIFSLLSALDTGLRAVLKHLGHSPHQAMMHGKVLPLSTDPYEEEE